MSSGKGFFLGLGATLGGGLVLAGLCALIGYASEKASLIAITCVGLVQLLYVIPMFRNAKKTGNESMKIGLVIGASIVFLFWAACGGLLLSLSGSNFH